MPVSVFSMFLTIAEKENQTESNWPETSRRSFFHQKKPTEYRRWARESRGHHEGGGVPYPLGASPTSWPPRGPPDLFPTPTPLIYTQTSTKKPSSGVPSPQASIATKNQSRPVPAPCRRAEYLSGGHLHPPGAFHDEEGVVHPWGWGYVPVAMCLISLSLSLVFSLWHDLDVSRALLL